jgi:pyrroloquinoline quinone biosynthesis protein D
MTALTAQSQPRIGHGFRLQWEEAQSSFVLLYPEGMVKLNQSAGEIMKRCDGKADLTAIVADIESAFNAQGLDNDVRGFIEVAAKQRWLTWE